MTEIEKAGGIQSGAHGANNKESAAEEIIALTERRLYETLPGPLGKIPEYVLQHNAISQGSYDISVIARKVIAMAMSLLPPDLSELTAQFTLNDFFKALGIERGGLSDQLIINALTECTKHTLILKTKRVINNQEIYTMAPFFSLAQFNKTRGIITMTFNKDLADFLVGLQRMYTKIKLRDLGKLQSRYAIRIYEMAMSYAGFEGKKGNNKSAWYFEISIDEFKRALSVKADEYQRTEAFKRRVIEGPVKEINNANIGLEIKTESIKQGRSLTGTRFNCKTVSRKIDSPSPSNAKTPKNPKQKRGKDRLAPAAVPDGDIPVEKEREMLKTLYPEEYSRFFAEEREKEHNGFGSPQTWSMIADIRAMRRLQEKYGIQR